MKLVYLGTSGAMPTIKRGLSSTVLVLDKEYIMVDCGEGTTRQFLKSNLKWNKPMTILITHMHSDHVMGLFGLLQSMDLMGRTAKVDIYGVRGIETFTHSVNRAVNFKFGFDLNIHELRAGDTITHKGFDVTTCKSKHQIPSLAYRIELPDKEGHLNIEKCLELGIDKNSKLLGELKSGKDVELSYAVGSKTIYSKDVVGEPEKGKVICFSGDTRPTEELGEFYKGADYLTHESTFQEDEQELAQKTKHSTSYEAGFIASKNGVKHLILNHFSARHPITEGFYEEAKQIHSNVVCSKDLMEIELE